MSQTSPQSDVGKCVDEPIRAQLAFTKFGWFWVTGVYHPATTEQIWGQTFHVPGFWSVVDMPPSVNSLEDVHAVVAEELDIEVAPHGPGVTVSYFCEICENPAYLCECGDGAELVPIYSCDKCKSSVTNCSCAEVCDPCREVEMETSTNMLERIDEIVAPEHCAWTARSVSDWQSILRAIDFPGEPYSFPAVGTVYVTSPTTYRSLPDCHEVAAGITGLLHCDLTAYNSAHLSRDWEVLQSPKDIDRDLWFTAQMNVFGLPRDVARLRDSFISLRQWATRERRKWSPEETCRQLMTVITLIWPEDICSKFFTDTVPSDIFKVKKTHRFAHGVIRDDWSTWLRSFVPNLGGLELPSV